MIVSSEVATLNVARKCPACGSQLQLALKKNDHVRFSCTNDKCPIVSVLFDSSGQLQYWTKFKRIGETGSVYTKIVYDAEKLAVGNHLCLGCGKPFCAGDIITISCHRSGGRGESSFFHELCYELQLKKVNEDG